MIKTITIRVSRNDYNKYFYTREEAIEKSKNISHNEKSFMGTPVIKVGVRYILADDIMKLPGNNIPDVFRMYKYGMSALESFPRIKWIICK